MKNTSFLALLLLAALPLGSSAWPEAPGGTTQGTVIVARVDSTTNLAALDTMVPSPSVSIPPRLSPLAARSLDITLRGAASERARVQDAAASMVEQGPVIAVSYAPQSDAVTLFHARPGRNAEFRYVTAGVDMSVPMTARLRKKVNKLPRANFTQSMRILSEIFDGVQERAWRLSEEGRSR